MALRGLQKEGSVGFSRRTDFLILIHSTPHPEKARERIALCYLAKLNPFNDIHCERHVALDMP